MRFTISESGVYNVAFDNSSENVVSCILTDNKQLMNMCATWKTGSAAHHTIILDFTFLSSSQAGPIKPPKSTVIDDDHKNVEKVKAFNYLKEIKKYATIFCLSRYVRLSLVKIKQLKDLHGATASSSWWAVSAYPLV